MMIIRLAVTTWSVAEPCLWGCTCDRGQAEAAQGGGQHDRRPGGGEGLLAGPLLRPPQNKLVAADAGCRQHNIMPRPWSSPSAALQERRGNEEAY